MSSLFSRIYGAVGLPVLRTVHAAKGPTLRDNLVEYQIGAGIPVPIPAVVQLKQLVQVGDPQESSIQTRATTVRVYTADVPNPIPNRDFVWIHERPNDVLRKHLVVAIIEVTANEILLEIA